IASPLLRASPLQLLGSPVARSSVQTSVSRVLTAKRRPLNSLTLSGHRTGCLSNVSYRTCAPIRKGSPDAAAAGIQCRRGEVAMKRANRSSRRQLLQMGAAVGGSLLTGQGVFAAGTDPRKLGAPLGPYGERSPFEKAVRWRRDSRTPATGSS